MAVFGGRKIVLNVLIGESSAVSRSLFGCCIEARSLLFWGHYVTGRAKRNQRIGKQTAKKQQRISKETANNRQ
jgi:hypothetical protein